MVASRRSPLPARRGRRHRVLAQVRQPGRVPGAPSPRCLGSGFAGACIRLIVCPWDKADRPGQLRSVFDIDVVLSRIAQEKAVLAAPNVRAIRGPVGDSEAPRSGLRSSSGAIDAAREQLTRVASKGPRDGPPRHGYLQLVAKTLYTVDSFFHAPPACSGQFHWWSHVFEPSANFIARGCRVA